MYSADAVPASRDSGESSADSGIKLRKHQRDLVEGLTRSHLFKGEGKSHSGLQAGKRLTNAPSEVKASAFRTSFTERVKIDCSDDIGLETPVDGSCQ